MVGRHKALIGLGAVFLLEYGALIGLCDDGGQT